MGFLPRQSYDLQDESLTHDVSSKAIGFDQASNLVEVKSCFPIPMQPEQPSLIHTLTPKSIQWQSYLRPLWWVSLGLHLLVLQFPLPNKQPPPKGVQSVKITKIASAPKVTPKVQPVTPSSTQPKPVPRKTSRIPITKPKSVTKSPVPQPTPTTATTPQSNPGPEKHKKSGNSDDKAQIEFPNYPDAIKSCADFCFKAENANIEEVATYFKTILSKENWDIKLEKEDATRRIYKVTKGETKVLSILMAQPAGTIYALADRELSTENLSRIEESIAEVGSLLSEKGADEADKSATFKPEIFRQGSNIFGLYEFKNTVPDKLWTGSLEKNFGDKNFEVSLSSKRYGDGPIYILKKELFIGYLNLVPNVEKNGTVIVFWKVPPN